MSFLELCEKEVINVCDCKVLGCVHDIEFDPECGRICTLIIPGQGKYFGLFCREEEIRIPWCDIVKIGPDIILVEFNPCT